MVTELTGVTINEEHPDYRPADDLLDLPHISEVITYRLEDLNATPLQGLVDESQYTPPYLIEFELNTKTKEPEHYSINDSLGLTVVDYALPSAINYYDNCQPLSYFLEIGYDPNGMASELDSDKIYCEHKHLSAQLGIRITELVDKTCETFNLTLQQTCYTVNMSWVETSPIIESVDARATIISEISFEYLQERSLENGTDEYMVFTLDSKYSFMKYEQHYASNSLILDMRNNQPLSSKVNGLSFVYNGILMYEMDELNSEYIYEENNERSFEELMGYFGGGE